MSAHEAPGMRLAAIVLAAGHSRRFGSDKLAADFAGEPLLHHAIRAARAAPVRRVIVVCGKHVEPGRWDAPPPVDVVVIDSAALSDSLRAGISAAGEVEGAFVFLGDMPLVPHGVAHLLAAALGQSFAAIPRCGGRDGHPVLIARRAFGAVALLEGDAGAGRLLKARSDVVHVDIEDDGVLLDVDRADDLASIGRRTLKPDWESPQ